MKINKNWIKYLLDVLEKKKINNRKENQIKNYLNSN